MSSVRRRHLGALLVLGAIVSGAALGCSSDSSGDPGATAVPSSAGGAGPTVSTNPAVVSSTHTLPTIPKSTSTTSGTPVSAGPQVTLNAQRKVWDDLAINRYTFTYNVVCFCSAAISGPFTVTIEDGAVVAAEAPPDASNGELAPSYKTIGDLFDLVQEAIDDKADVEITYDPTYGFPQRLMIDPDPRVTDDEVTYVVTSFEPG